MYCSADYPLWLGFHRSGLTHALFWAHVVCVSIFQAHFSNFSKTSTAFACAYRSLILCLYFTATISGNFSLPLENSNNKKRGHYQLYMVAAIPSFLHVNWGNGRHN